MSRTRQCACGYVDSPDSNDPPASCCPRCGAPRETSAEPIFDDEPDTAAETRLHDEPKPQAPLWLQLLLNPEAIQRLLGVGGAVCVIGIIIWLVSVGVFDDPRILAASCGAGTLAVLGSGWGVSLKSRHQMAGQALTFLGCLLAPLNLWLYDAQNLVTLEGHLWIGGLACALLYLATVRVLRSPLYLYAFEAGVTLTLVLLLGAFDRATDSLFLCSSLVTLAGMSIHAERAFAVDHSEFDRKRYGWPLFVSGQVQLAIAMTSVLALQVVGWTSWNSNEPILWMTRLASSPLWTAGLWLYAAYLWMYSDLFVLRKAVFHELSRVSLLLAALTLFHHYVSPDATIALLSLTILAITALPLTRTEKSRSSDASGLALLLPILPMMLGLGRHLQLVWFSPDSATAVGWHFAGAMLCVATTTGLSARLSRDDQGTVGLLTLAGLSLWLSVDWTLRMLDITTLTQQLPILLTVPLAIAAMQYLRPAPTRGSMRWSANLTLLAGAILYLLALPFADHHLASLQLLPGHFDTLLLAVCCFELAAFHALSDRRSSMDPLASCCATIFLLGGMACVTRYFDVPETWFAACLMIAGLVSVFVERVTGAGSRGGQWLIGFGQLVAACRGLALLAGSGDASWFEVLPGWLAPAALSGIAILATRSKSVRRWHTVSGIGLMFLTMALILRRLHLADYQQFEIAVEVLGLLLIGAGYSLRLKETANHQETGTTELLWIGSLLATGPVMICTLLHRFGPVGVSLGDELGLVTISVLMLASGCILQTRATTLLGGITLTSYLFVLLAMLIYLPQITIGAYLAIGGGLVFVTGVLLSVYRDRLLALPSKISQREGVFQIIGWR